MKITIDVKSALCGLCVGVLAALTIGAAAPANSIGKFRVSAGPSYALVVDTETGRTWMANFTSATSIKGTDGDFYEPKAGR